MESVKGNTVKETSKREPNFDERISKIRKSYVKTKVKPEKSVGQRQNFFSPLFSGNL